MSKVKTVFALSIGVINIQTGKTQYDWSIYDGNNAENCALFLCGDFLLFGSKENSGLEVGDKLVLRNNDTQRKLGEANVTAILTCEKDTLVKELFEHRFDYRQLRAFAKKAFNRKLRTSYSIKGVTFDKRDSK